MTEDEFRRGRYPMLPADPLPLNPGLQGVAVRDTPSPVAVDPITDPDAAYDAWFAEWAPKLVASHAAKYPGDRPFDLAAFDGCTMAPDICRHCCLRHDLDYWHAKAAQDRADADRRLRECIAAFATKEGRDWAWFWRLNSWAFYLAVRIFGGFVIYRRRRQWATEEATMVAPATTHATAAAQLGAQVTEPPLALPMPPRMRAPAEDVC